MVCLFYGWLSFVELHILELPTRQLWILLDILVSDMALENSVQEEILET